VGDLKTTQERRDRFREWLHDDTRDNLSIRAWCVAEDACHDVDTLLAENAKLRAAEALVAKAVADNTPRPLDEWHEDDGPVLWWRFPIKEPPYAGTLLDDDWPVYATHWTRLHVPAEARAALGGT
jgi:hypothetical protein